uniref:Uncharacterized protein n=1 Tax=Zea mays TaxID=4577 RepID=A0A804PC72_MAIZE
MTASKKETCEVKPSDNPTASPLSSFRVVSILSSPLLSSRVYSFPCWLGFADDDGDVPHLGAGQGRQRAGGHSHFRPLPEVLVPRPRRAYLAQAQKRRSIDPRGDKSYAKKRDRRKSSSQLLLEGSKREAEDKIVPQEIDADDSDVEPKSDDEREDNTTSSLTLFRQKWSNCEKNLGDIKIN